MNKYNKAGISLVLIAFSGVLSAGELPNTENMQGMQFNFSTPGARSLGMGGAFIGRADDATAAFANPAGLTGLFAPEISFEYRQTDFTTPHSVSGAHPNITTSEADSDIGNLSYISYVKADPGSDWVFSLFAHQLMDFETSFQGEAITNVGLGTAFPTDNFLEIDISSYGLSTAYRVSDKVSVGGSLIFYDFSKNGSTTRFGLDDNLARTSVVQNVQDQSGDDSATGVTLGAIFALSDRANLGLVYRSMPKFDALSRALDSSGVEFANQPYDFEVPDVFGVGLSFQASDNLTINFDVNKVSYGDLTSPVFDAFGNAPGTEQGDAAATVAIDDGTEFHLGLEYTILKPSGTSIALRAGAWQDPAHTVEFQGSATTGQDRFHDAMFRGSDDETHISAGIGFIFGTKGQIDIAADFSELQDTISVSGVFRF
jgi:long-subunit fatty acid transport protein